MASFQSPDTQALSLSLGILLCTYTNFLSGQPPNPTPYNSKYRDTIAFTVTPRALFTRTLFSILLGVSHALLCLTYPSPPAYFCPNPSNLSSDFLTWNPRTILSIAAVLLGSYIRLSAFSGLGANFTFRLDAPKKLITTGLYSYVQHPSYTGKILIIFGNLLLLQRQNGFLGCWLPAWIVNANLFWKARDWIVILVVLRGAWKRVQEEEMMLKETFGEKWEAWHKKTKRFVPGLF